jgi:mannonate dehydratase
MDRRSFLAGATVASSLVADQAAAQTTAQRTAARGVAPDWTPQVPKIDHPAGPKGKGRPKLGTQHSHEEEALRLYSALGVTQICCGKPGNTLEQGWSVDNLKRIKEQVEKHGIALEMIPLPLSSAYITRHEFPDLMLGKSPGRDRAIDQICQMIRNTAQAGIPALKYNMSILGVVRTPASRGRGGVTLSTFNYAAGKQDPPLTEAGPVPADVYWERITYFLDRVIPVANEYKIRMACHPHDPGMPIGKGWRGVETVLGNVDGLKKFVSIQESPYHGLNFCQGTVCEMLEDPNKQIHDVIRYFGSRGKIFNVHFRNIKGGWLNFQEVLPDEGDVDMMAAARTYKEVGYSGMLMPDHVPRMEGDQGGRLLFSFSFGYIRAIIQMLEKEG